ncbi:MAG: aspartate-semialdehyde dehydrogenase, partial [Candidatus Omnitrophota bacterium]
AIVIDNGADFRLKDDVPLVIPEVNPDALNSHRGIIANPNCSTIQMLAAIAPIYNCVGIKRIIVSTYQAVSGAGRGALGQLWQQTSEIMDKYTLSQVSSQPININASSVQNQIAFNTVPCIGSFGEFGYTTEEWKMVTETHKILSDQNIKISATCVRVPVFNCHSESVYFETVKQLEPEAVKEILSNAKGIIVVDSPMPKDCSGRDEVFVGRIRKDPFVLNGLWLWIVSDNLRKGAATNAVQIAECLIDNY